MIESILIIVSLVAMGTWLFFTRRESERIYQIYNILKSTEERDDDSILLYSEYVIRSVKNNDKPVKYSEWIKRQ